MRTITIDLANISQSVSDVKELRDDMSGAIDRSLEKVAKQAAKYASHQVELLGAVDTGDLMNSITNYKSGVHEQTVIAQCDHADYVEYGTGIVGAGQSHPSLDVPWAYDVNNHGNKGWVYEGKDGKFYRTRGQASRPYMYNTYLHILSNGQWMFNEALNDEYSN